MSFNLLYKLDLYAPPFPLRFQKKRNYKSKIGIIFGLFTIFLFFYFFLNGTLLIMSRTQYFIVEESNYIYKPKTNFSHIPFLIHLQNNKGDDYTFNSSIFNISFSIMIYKDIDNEITENQEDIPLINCASNKYFSNKYKDFFDYYSLNEYLCPNYTKETFFLEGDFSEGGIIKYLSLEISVCKHNNCIDLKKIQSLIEEMKLILYIKIADPIYNEYKNPINFFYKSFQIRLSNSQSKDYMYFFYQKNFTTDNGLIISKPNTYSLFDYDSLQLEFLEFNNKYYFKGNFYSINKFIDIKRTYKGFIEMYGEIGGNCSAIFSLLNIIISYLLKNMICEDIINIITQKNIEIKNNTNKIILPLKKKNVNSNSVVNENNLNKSNISSNSEKSLYKNYMDFNIIDRIFTNKEKVKLNWKYYFCPFYFCSNNDNVKKFRVYKDYIYSIVSLEKLFEMDTMISMTQKNQKINQFTLSKLIGESISLKNKNNGNLRNIINNRNGIKNNSYSNSIFNRNLKLFRKKK